MRIILLAACGLLTVTLSIQGQTSPSKPKAAPPKPVERSVYFDSWDEGELKDCEIVSQYPDLLDCDMTKDWNGSLVNLEGAHASDNPGATDEQDEQAALAYIEIHSKKFLVTFKDTGPKLQAGVKFVRWRCIKDKTIACTR